MYISLIQLIVIYTYQKSKQAVLSEQHGWQYKTNIVRVTVYLEGEVLLLCVVEAGWNVKVKYTGLLLIVVVYVVYIGKLDLTERIRNTTFRQALATQSQVQPLTTTFRQRQTKTHYSRHWWLVSSGSASQNRKYDPYFVSSRSVVEKKSVKIFIQEMNAWSNLPHRNFINYTLTLHAVVLIVKNDLNDPYNSFY